MKGNPEKRKTHEKLYKYYKTQKNSKQVSAHDSSPLIEFMLKMFQI